jgi:hypothetical protein
MQPSITNNDNELATHHCHHLLFYRKKIKYEKKKEKNKEKTKLEKK